MIEPHKQTYLCGITGKISTEAVKIGEAWISKEGIKKLQLVNVWLYAY